LISLIPAQHVPSSAVSPQFRIEANKVFLLGTKSTVYFEFRLELWKSSQKISTKLSTVDVEGVSSNFFSNRHLANDLSSVAVTKKLANAGESGTE